jgi:hypothetical protein
MTSPDELEKLARAATEGPWSIDERLEPECVRGRDNDDPNEPIADNGASVIDGWRDLARRILSTPQPADGCSSNEGAGQ